MRRAGGRRRDSPSDRPIHTIGGMPGPHTVALFWGDDEFLLRQAALELLAERNVRAAEVDGSDWRGGETSDLATPSLWGEQRALLVTRCQALPDAGLREIRAYIEAPSPDALCVLTLVSRARSLPPLAKAVQATGGLVRQVSVKRQDLPRWILERARIRGLALSPPGATALVGTIGEDPAALDQSVEQLATAFPGASVGPEQVRSQFQGLGEQRVWDLCDRALSGRLPEALVVLRSLLDQKEDPLLVLGGIASRVRDLLRVQGLPDRMSSNDAAKAAGLRFDWQVRRYREQARRFTPESLTGLHARIVEADRALKGGAPGDVVLTALVAVMTGEEDATLDLPMRVSR
jgi:DNA polymerase-3 subunit delta